ncbi:MAG: hypothetical protein IKV38_03120, partial [Clostridia bacterium]|nr:hypothetical protein [Clostridia bacterium]
MSMQEHKKQNCQVDEQQNQNDKGDKLIKQKNGLKGDFAVWLVTILILVAFGVVIYFLGLWGGIQKEYFATITLPNEIRVGQKDYAQLTFENDYAVMDQQIVWLID